MSREHALELVLAPDDDERVRSTWQTLERGGVRSSARHRGPTHRPHLTVASSASAPDESVLRRAREVWAPLLPLRLGTGGLVLLGRRRLSLAVLIVPAPAVQDARARTVRAWPGVDERPWVPHVTLGTRLRVPEVGAALAVLSGAPSPREPVRAPTGLTACGLRWWDPEHEVVSDVAGAAA
ncbi:2'-5' RNA ligase family protein [Serinicoccus kebangsaanensis]|uniref:2'-5' RNA ligase family protein n=1 Tax=Serinicoccus kebangsaanensis TaxID=2602069 RepID=UPI00178C71D4|nr:2'-5' RNA ligase family protein [Serinicoccus kebangsaanensis]